MKYITFFLLATLAATQLAGQSVTISPATITRSAGQTQQFSLSGPTALISNVTWSLDPASGAGTITSSGLFTAPSTIAAAVTVKVIATPVLDPARRVEASVRLVPLTVSVTPATATLTVAQTRQFTAAVTPSGSSVVWSLDPPGVGSISPAGLYTAPASIAATRTVRVVAVSAVDGAKSDSATITLNPLNLTVSPTRVTLDPVETRQFNAASNNGPATVTWSVDPAGRGTVSATGLYTAPATVPVEVEARVIATSTVDNSRIAVATVVLRPLSLTIRPTSDDLTITQTRQFTVTAPAGVDARVTWRLDPATGLGAISTAGLYTAPGSIPAVATVRVIATSVVDASRTVSATVRLSPLDISISPQRTTLTIGETRQFTASVPNGAPSQMAWSVDPAGRGTVSATGLYTAPNSIAAETTVQVIARSAVDNTRFAAATVTLAPLNLTVSPASVILRAAQTRQFNARVAGADANVTWRIDPATAGSISATGLYTAPATLSAESTVQVIATSRADTSVSASATIRLKPSDISVTPATVSLTVNEARQFTARVTGGGAVTWSLAPPGMGTVSAAGLYTAPAAIPAETTVRVIATGVTDPADSAFGLVTLSPQDLSISPSTVTMTVDQTRQFTVRGPGNTNPAVTWSVEPATGAGTVSSTGLYRAPVSIPAATLVRVVATLVSDTTRKLTATVTLEPLDLTVSPLSPSLKGGQTQQFTARVQAGAPDTVTWRTDPAGTGSISATGLYTTPASVAATTRVRVIATSTVDTARSAEATLTLRAADVDVFPLTSSLKAGGTIQLKARVFNGSNQAVTWTVTGPGTIASTGLYTAPAAVAAQTLVTVRATSVADPTVFGTATITLQTCTGLCVTVSPKSVSRTASQTQQFSASVSSGTAGVIWSISPTRGTISATGLYTAPAAITVEEIVTVTATSTADATRLDTAAVLLIAEQHSQLISVEPRAGRPGQALAAVRLRFSPGGFSGTVTANFGPGVSVGGSQAGMFGPATVVDPSTLQVSLSIAADAAIGVREISIQDSRGILSTPGSFSVEFGPLQLSATPPTSYAGQTISLVAKNFPPGPVAPSDVLVTLAPTEGPGNPVTTPASSLQVDASGDRIIGFVLPAAVNPASNPQQFIVRVSGTIAGRALVTDFPAFVTVLPQAAIESLSPSFGRAGESVLVTLTARNFQFVEGSTEARFGAGIAVGNAAAPPDGFGPVVLTGTNTAQAAVFLAPSAANGPRTVTLRSGGQEVQLVAGFSVTPGIPRLTITEPLSLSATNTSPATVRGTVSDPQTTVTVNGIAATLTGTAFLATVPLVEGNNTLTAVGRRATGPAGSTSTVVTLDTTPPRLAVTVPGPNDLTVSTSTIAVAGVVGDQVVGTVSEADVSVTVNGVAASVANRGFAAAAVPLLPGANTIQLIARDRVGNSTTQSLVVTRINPVRPEIRLVSGSNQTGTVRQVLAAPLIVKLFSAAGLPMANRPVIFKVAQGDSTLVGPPEAVLVYRNGASQAAIVVNTNQAGEAAVGWTLGQRAGAGYNRVEATASGFDGIVTFMATATPGIPTQVNADGGAGQRGIIGAPLARPFVVVATDASGNRVAGIPVEFSVKKGNGLLDGQSLVVRNTDRDGRAAVVLTLGPSEGVENNVVVASHSGTPCTTATFTASGSVPGDVAATTISGTVLDNTDKPVAGVTVRLLQPYLGSVNNVPVPAAPPVLTDAQGRFRINTAPVGEFKLLIDSATALRPGTWASLEYDITSIAGRDNTVGTPIFVLPIDTVNRLCVSETTGGVLTSPLIPGFSLKVLPGSVTFAGGSRTGCLSATLVHLDKIPMPPPMGLQPRYVMTIQPHGATFNPPAAVTIPNTSAMPARSVTEMFSFDHDLNAFVSTGTGTVSDDGSILVSDAGTGVVKAGWHAAGPAPPPQCVNSCGTCKVCADGGTCDPGPRNGTRASPTTCCYQGEEIPDRNPLTCCENGVNTVLSYDRMQQACPNRTQYVARAHAIDGCSIPQEAIDAVFPGSSPQDPLGGIDFIPGSIPSTAFGRPQAPIPFGSGQALVLPCNYHDICYQTCRSNKEQCDLNLGRMARENICLVGYASATCPFSGSELYRCFTTESPTLRRGYFLERSQCPLVVGMVLAGLGLDAPGFMNGGLTAYQQRQKEYCQCCDQ